MAENTNPLDLLEDTGLIEYTEEGLPIKTERSRHLQEAEVCAMILEHVVQDITVSNREIARRTSLDPRTVGKARRSDRLIQMLAEWTNKRMVGIRSLAIEELDKMLRDKNLNQNTKIKAIQTILTHSERWTEIMLQAGKDVPKIKVEDLLKELEDM